MCNRICEKKVGEGQVGGGGGLGVLPPRKFENCKFMCNRLRTGRYAPGFTCSDI